MKIQNIIPATDWFYVTETVRAGTKQIIVWRIAVWAQTSDDRTKSSRVTGLVSFSSPTDDKNPDSESALKPLPPLPGTYKHLSELNKAELEALAANGVKNIPL